jgi:hypothetical protein
VLFRYGHVFLVLIWTNFKSAMVLRVREGNIYRLRVQPMGDMENKGRETEDEE